LAVAAWLWQLGGGSLAVAAWRRGGGGGSLVEVRWRVAMAEVEAVVAVAVGAAEVLRHQLGMVVAAAMATAAGWQQERNGCDGDGGTTERNLLPPGGI
jgi:hypothetical protein